jgi:hypothetical protein
MELLVFPVIKKGLVIELVVFSGVPDIAAVIAAIGVAGYECAVENADSRNVP